MRVSRITSSQRAPNREKGSMWSHTLREYSKAFLDRS